MARQAILQERLAYRRNALALEEPGENMASSLEDHGCLLTRSRLFFVDNGADIRRPSRFGGVALVLFEDKELRFALSRRALIMLGIGAGASLLAAFSGIGLAKLRGGKGSEGMRRTSSSPASETSRSAELP